MNPEQPSSPSSPPPQPTGWGPPPQPQPQTLPPVTPQAPIAPSAFDSHAAPTPTQALGETYLNEIAAKEPIRVHKFAIIGLVGGVLVLLIVALSIMMNSGGPDLTTQAKSINGRVNTLKTLATAQQKHLQDNKISEANTTLSSVLTSISSSLSDTMKARKIVLSSSASPTEKKYATTLTKKLDDAYQRGTIDRTYAPQMAYELSILRSKLIAMKNSSSASAVTTFSKDAVTNLDAIILTFKEFSSTN
ncbi:MAG: hypothetical protein ABIP74_04700 [Candidatus Saccharimonas sp.]